MEGWKKMTIGDVCQTISDTYHGNDDEVVLVNTSDVFEGKILNHKSVPNINLKGQFKKTFKKDDILYSEIRPANKRYAYVDFEDTENYIASTKLMVLRPNMDAVLPRFLLAYLSSSHVLAELQHLAETRSGTFPQITFSSELAPMPITVPNFEIQEKIVGMLDSIEGKMKNNEDINKNLLEQAQAIYKSWFVDFEPFNGTKPDDWNMGIIEDLAKEIICGKTPSTKVADYYGSDIPFITIPDMHDNVYTVSTERYLSFLGAQSQANKMLPINAICVSCIGTAGLVTLVATESQTNQQINSIIPKNGYSPFYIYLLMQTLSEVINKLGQSGSTIVNLNKAQFSKIKVLVPSVASMKEFDVMVSPLFSLIHENQEENIRLSSLRDTLLPRLMSGEIDVSNIDL